MRPAKFNCKILLLLPSLLAIPREGVSRTFLSVPDRRRNRVEDATGNRTVLHIRAVDRSFRLVEFIGGCGAATELLESIRRGGSRSVDGAHISTRSSHNAQSRDGKHQTWIGFGYKPWI